MHLHSSTTSDNHVSKRNHMEIHRSSAPMSGREERSDRKSRSQHKQPTHISRTVVMPINISNWNYQVSVSNLVILRERLTVD